MTLSDSELISSNIKTASQPSKLKITDMRLVRTTTGGPILKIDTNQGLYGLGEVRDGASKTYALLLKSRILGENPCNVDKFFARLSSLGFMLARVEGSVVLKWL